MNSAWNEDPYFRDLWKYCSRAREHQKTKEIYFPLTEFFRPLAQVLLVTHLPMSMALRYGISRWRVAPDKMPRFRFFRFTHYTINNNVKNIKFHMQIFRVYYFYYAILKFENIKYYKHKIQFLTLNKKSYLSTSDGNIIY